MLGLKRITVAHVCANVFKSFATCDAGNKDVFMIRPAALFKYGYVYFKLMYGVSRRYDGSRPQSVFVFACVRLWLCRPIRDAQSWPQT